MIPILNDAWRKTIDQVDGLKVFKHKMVNLEFDSRKDHLICPKLMDLVAEEMKRFIAE